MTRRTLLTFLIALLIVSQLACNYSNVSILATPTASPTATLPPTATPLPPTETPTLPPPTATLPPPPTEAPVINTPIPPTATATPFPTKAAVKALPKGRFSAVFEGGTFTFRTNEASTYITLKEITLGKAKCRNGKTVSTHLTFEDITYFEIENGAFTISFDRTTVSGSFDTINTAHGTIYIKINAAKSVCEIGPVSWTGAAPME